MDQEHWIKQDVERKAFWKAVNGWFAACNIPNAERSALVHAILGVESVADCKLTRQQAQRVVQRWLAGEYPDLIAPPFDEAEHERNVNEMLGSTDDVPSAPLAPVAPAPPAPPIHNEARALAWTQIVLNGYRINVTAREGASAGQVASTVGALIGALRMLYEDDSVRSLGAVQDGRDSVQWFKGGQKVAEVPSAPPTPSVAPVAPVAPDQKQSKPRIGADDLASQPSPAGEKAPLAPVPSGSPASETTCEQVALVEKVLGEDGSTQYRLYPLLTNGKPGLYPFVVRESQQRAVAMLAEHFDLEMLTLRQKYAPPYPLEYVWRKGKPVPNAPGKFYRDIVSIRQKEQERNDDA
jgi:hypothetical protein